MIFNVGTITSLIFVVLSIAALLAISFDGKGFFRSPFRKYMIAAAGVYVSGTVLVAILYLKVSELPVQFVFISEFVMLGIFIFSVCMINWLVKHMDKLRAEISQEQEKDDLED